MGTIIKRKILSFLVGSIKDCDGVIGRLSIEYWDSPEEEVITSTWRRSLCSGSQKKGFWKSDTRTAFQG